MLLQKRVELVFQGFRLGQRSEALGNLSVGGDQKLREIPFDRLSSQEPWLFPLHELVQRMRARTVDVDLRKHGKRHVEPRITERFDLVLAPRLLGTELI